MDLQEAVMNLPYATDIKGSLLQAEKYEKLLFKFYQHRDDERANDYLTAVVQYLILLDEPSDMVVDFLVQFERPLRKLLDKAKVGIQLPKPKKDDIKAVEMAAGNLVFGSKKKPARKPKLYSSLNYTNEYTDLTIVAGKKDFQMVFEVHIAYLTKHCLVLGQRIQERFDPQKFWGKKVLEEPDINPIALDHVLSWVYGDPFRLPNSEKDALPLVVNCVNIAVSLNLQPLIADIVEILTKTLLHRDWSLSIIPTLGFLYTKGEITPPVRIPQKRLMALVHCFWTKNQLEAFQETLKTVTVVGSDGKPVLGYAEFFQDMSVALLAIVNRCKRPNKER
ncbi:hypothetical protein TWF694_008309 [Orbilia ellipsospora]|uniref:BTB domain-containing protein n=1 Tax=Orbilia ellipsospora TaxID=2528407 RepID=A0AAV9XFP8_9PEZI